MAVKLEDDRDFVILLHGIGHRNLNMLGMEWTMRRAGYRTINISYPSTRKSLKEIAVWLHTELLKHDLWSHHSKVNFVTHSMGGLVVREYLRSYRKEIPEKGIGRVVMIAPPNNGSEVADILQKFLPYKWFFGPAGQELTTSSQKLNKYTAYYEVGVIAGTAGWPYILGLLNIAGKNDGRVSVESTKLNGMKDHIEINATHSFISWKSIARKQAAYFLKSGAFLKDHKN